MTIAWRFVFLALLLASGPGRIRAQETRLQKEGTFLYPPNLTMGPDNLLLGMTIGSVKGHPVSGTINADNTSIDARGQTIATHYRSRIFRDSAGRTRIEWTITPMEKQPDQGRDIIELYDPATRIVARISPATKSAAKIYIPRPEEMEKYACNPQDMPEIPPSALRDLAIPKVSQIELPHEVIDGRKLRHGRERVTTPRKPPASGVASSQVTDYWFSQELQFFVRVKRTGPAKSQNLITLSDISSSEPDPALFAIPSDYTVSQPSLATHPYCGPEMTL